MSGPFTDHHCGLYQPRNNGDGDCGICGWDETAHLPSLENGEAAVTGRERLEPPVAPAPPQETAK